MRLRTFQPQFPVAIDRDNFFGSKVVYAWHGGMPRFSTSGYPAKIASTIATAAGPLGKAALYSAASSAENIQLANSGDDYGLATNSVTVYLIRRSRDTTLRNSTAFGYCGGPNDRVLAHVPYGDGNVYWDFGNATSASGRISVAITKSTNVEHWMFTAGPFSGRTIWRNGLVLAANSSAQATRATTAAGFYLGGNAGAAEASDIEEQYFFALFNYEFHQQFAYSMLANPWQIFQPSRARVYAFPASAAAGFTPYTPWPQMQPIMAQ